MLPHGRQVRIVLGGVYECPNHTADPDWSWTVKSLILSFPHLLNRTPFIFRPPDQPEKRDQERPSGKEAGRQGKRSQSVTLTVVPNTDCGHPPPYILDICDLSASKTHPRAAIQQALPSSEVTMRPQAFSKSREIHTERSLKDEDGSLASSVSLASFGVGSNAVSYP